MMEKIKMVLASRNGGKIRELQRLLDEELGAQVQLLSLDEVGILDDVEETGETFAENALLKADHAVKSGYIALADDSGLTVRALGGAPGVHSARYAEDHNDAANNALLLKNLGGEKDRAAAFVSSLACAFPSGGAPILVEGRVEGEILQSPRGENGFGYDPLFFAPAIGKTLAEASEKEKNDVSHRGAAVRAFAPLFAARMGIALPQKKSKEKRYDNADK